METIDVLQRTIEACGRLKDIVRTMKAMASVSIRQYERAVTSLQQYAETVEMGLAVVVQRVGLPMSTGREGTKGVIVFGSDHGLCGRFNETMCEYVSTHLEGAPEPLIVVVGSRVDAGLTVRGLKVEESFFVPGSVAGITLTVQQMLHKIDNWRSEGVEVVDLFHHKSSARGHYHPIRQRLLPLEEGFFRRLVRRPWAGRSLPGFTLQPDVLLAGLLRQHLFISLYRACAESLAAEHGQRLTAMQLAEKNIGERLNLLTQAYRQLRQEQITSELLEVVAGFEAVEIEERKHASSE